MAKVKYVVYGDDIAHASANNNKIKLTVRGQDGDAFFTAKTKEEMRTIIKNIHDALASIRWELDRYGGVFSGLTDEEEREE